MTWGKGRISHRDLAFKFFLGHHQMLIVKLYKYLGIRIGRSGGWQHHFRHMADKIKLKTGEILGWARRYEIPLPLVTRVWEIYVRSAALYGGAICDAPTSAIALLDRAQRQAGRMVLGFDGLCLAQLYLQRWAGQRCQPTLSSKGLACLVEFAKVTMRTYVQLPSPAPLTTCLGSQSPSRWCGHGVGMSPQRTNLHGECSSKLANTRPDNRRLPSWRANVSLAAH